MRMTVTVTVERAGRAEGKAAPLPKEKRPFGVRLIDYILIPLVFFALLSLGTWFGCSSPSRPDTVAARTPNEVYIIELSHVYAKQQGTWVDPHITDKVYLVTNLDGNKVPAAGWVPNGGKSHDIYYWAPVVNEWSKKELEALAWHEVGHVACQCDRDPWGSVDETPATMPTELRSDLPHLHCPLSLSTMETAAVFCQAKGYGWIEETERGDWVCGQHEMTMLREGRLSTRLYQLYCSYFMEESYFSYCPLSMDGEVRILPYGMPGVTRSGRILGLGEQGQ